MFVSRVRNRCYLLLGLIALMFFGESASLSFAVGIDRDLNPANLFGNDVYAYRVAVQPDGKILLSGSFNSVNGVRTGGFARLNPDGSLDPSFNARAIPLLLNIITVQPDGKILIAGVNGGLPARLLRLNSDGSIDPTFATFSGSVSTQELQVAPDGKILFQGRINHPNCGGNCVARLNSDGTFDSSFTVYSQLNQMFDMALLAQGQIAVAGISNPKAFAPYLRLLNPNGTFNRDMTPPSFVLRAQADGKLLAGGSGGDLKVRRFNADGNLDSTFIPYDAGNIAEIEVASDGKIVVANFQGASPTRLLTDGSVDPSFARLTPLSVIRDVAIQPDGKIILVGEPNPDAPRAIVRLDQSGQIDTTFNPVLSFGPVPTAFDFDGDRKTDYSVFRPSNGLWITLRSQAGYRAAPWGVSTDKLVPADYDGDGKTDLAVYRPSNGEWSILRSSNSTVFIGRFGASEDIPRPADFDGDGHADINVFRPSVGVWYRLNSSNNQFVVHNFGQSGDEPLIADFDGDQRSDIAVYRPSNGTWYWLRSSNGQFATAPFGIAEDVPIPADFDGDGKSDLSVFRPSSGYWFRVESSTRAFVPVPWGFGTDKPVAGDYDGDGKADIAVWRPSNGVFYTLRTNGNQYVAYPFGASTDVPIASAYGR